MLLTALLTLGVATDVVGSLPNLLWEWSQMLVVGCFTYCGSGHRCCWFVAQLILSHLQDNSEISL